MSEPHEGAISERVRVPMRDGVRLSVHIYRPAAQEKCPAIMLYTPYRKGPLGAPHPFTKHGYAVVYYDVRGTGDSEGFTTDMYSAPERQDGYDMVEWLASQPWCDGNVGMWGISFGAVVALQMAAAAPPHLKAIIARSGTDDPYIEWTNPGGSPRPYIYGCYAPIMTASNFSPPDPEEVGDRWEQMWAERLEKNVPWGIAFIQNLNDGPFWRARSLRGRYDAVRCAAFVVDGWADWYHTPLLRTFASLTVPRRALIGPWSHQWPDGGIPGPRIDWLREALKWFDRWLKGKDTGVTAEPLVTLFVREYSTPATILMEDRGRFRCENEWPIARTRHTPMYFGAGGVLRPAPPAGKRGSDALPYDPRVGACTGMHGGGPFNVNWAMPLDQRPDEVQCLTYTTAPLKKDTEVIGRPRAVLHFSCTAQVTQFAVKLCDVAPDGTSALVTKGFLNAAHRPDASPAVCPTAPHAPHPSPLPLGEGRVRACLASPLEPGKPYVVEVELLTCAYRFRKGHRMRVVVAAADLLNVWPTPQACVNTIYRGTQRPSHIVLPIVPPQEPALPEPDLKPSPQPAPRREDLEPPGLVVSRDLIADTATVQWSVRYGPRWSNEASFTVSARDPARASMTATASRGAQYGGKDVVVEARCVTASDAEAFRHTVELNITVDGRPHFRKDWSVSVPRPWM